MQIDHDTSAFLPCVCGFTPTRYSIGYGRRPYYMHCECGKRMSDGIGGLTLTFIACWNNVVRLAPEGSQCVTSWDMTTPDEGSGDERNYKMSNSIAKRHKAISDRLRSHDAKRKIIEGELLALRHECQHPNLKTWRDSGWGRMPSTESKCPDCGYRSSTPE